MGKYSDLGGHDLVLYAGVDNVFDEAYFSNIRINAYGGRYCEPAPGRTVPAGIELALYSRHSQGGQASLRAHPPPNANEGERAWLVHP